MNKTISLTAIPIPHRLLLGSAWILTTLLASCGDSGGEEDNTTPPSDLDAPSITDAEAQTYSKGVAITDLVFTNSGGGSLTDCSIRPTLPSGLTIERSSDNSTCIVTGAPTEVNAQTTYTITATNAAGTDNASVGISIRPLAPSLVDVDVQTYIADETIVELILINSGGGHLTECGIQPNLPFGITVDRSSDNSTCEITGTPLEIGAQTTYTVTASNITTSRDASITLAIGSVFLPNSVDITNTMAELSWTALSGATGYEVWRSEVGEGQVISRVQSSLTGTTYTDTTVEPDTDYYFLIAECTTSGCVDPGNSGPLVISSLTDTDQIILDGADYITAITIDNKTYALVSAIAEKGVQIIDISDPTTPMPVGSLDNTQIFSVFDITATAIGNNSYALVTSLDNNGIQIIDITDPSNPTVVGSLTDTDDTKLRGASGITTAVIDGNTYAVVATLFDDSVQIINISEPSNPMAVRSLADSDQLELNGLRGIATATIEGNTYVIVAAQVDDGVQIIDISDPTDPMARGSLDDSARADLELNGAFDITTTTIDGKTYALVAAQIDNGVQIIDISDPSAPMGVGSLTDTDDIELDGVRGITTSAIGSRTYALAAAQDEDAVQIIDISDPSTPTAVASVDNTTQTVLDGVTDITTVTIDGRTYALIAAVIDDAVQIIDITTPQRVVPASTSP